jgi:SAM-dependent methyltransferase
LAKSISSRPWNYTIHYHPLALRAVPTSCHSALDVGCGTGLFTHKLAERSNHVIGIDVDREVLEIARAYLQSDSRTELMDGDVMTHPFARASFDFISVVATLHHLPLSPALARFRDLLKPGGALAVIGFYKSQTIWDYTSRAAATPIARALRIRHGLSILPTRKHKARDTLNEIRSACDAILPGAVVRRLLLYRYSLIWRKPLLRGGSGR